MLAECFSRLGILPLNIYHDYSRPVEYLIYCETLPEVLEGKKVPELMMYIESEPAPLNHNRTIIKNVTLEAV